VKLPAVYFSMLSLSSSSSVMREIRTEKSLTKSWRAGSVWSFPWNSKRGRLTVQGKMAGGSIAVSWRAFWKGAQMIVAYSLTIQASFNNCMQQDSFQSSTPAGVAVSSS